jgi:MFS family permease
LMWAQIGTLIMATSLIQLANGFFGTFISLRVAIEDFGPTMSGIVLSSYFAGFTLGALRGERIIERVGHIRAYAAFAGLVVAATALMPLRVGPLPWLILRAAVGFGCAGLFVATESWLNAKAEPAQRGRVFSGYADAHDHMPANRVVAVSGRLILISGLGSIVGPLIGTSVMARFSIDGLLYFMAAATLFSALVAIVRRLVRAPPTHQGRTFEILTPQAAALAHDLLGPAEECSPPS